MASLRYGDLIGRQLKKFYHGSDSSSRVPEYHPTKHTLQLVKTKNDRFLIKVLTKMFRVVGRKYSPSETNVEGWFLTSEWSVEQERRFNRYLVLAAMKDLLLRKRQAESAAGMFLLYYGWKVKSTEKSKKQKRLIDA